MISLLAMQVIGTIGGTMTLPLYVIDGQPSSLPFTMDSLAVGSTGVLLIVHSLEGGEYFVELFLKRI